ncbi:MAG: hypothetical protein K8S23_05215 [Candidatus Cloacimonetes bacterium]|nr:hypothetical protein [Candidatus Cloacimonadota bacterium]
MYKSELLKEKYKAQKKLSDIAKKSGKDYFEIIKQDVKELFKEKGWELKISDRKGGYIS